MADKNMSNFLATDKVPDTIFGIPIVSRREDYTEADIAFFKEHPEAGGYYDMGDGEGEEPDNGPTNGPGVTRGAIDAGEVKHNRSAILGRAVKSADGTIYKTANDAFKAKFAEISHPGAAAEFRRSALDALDRDAKAPWLRAEYKRIASEETGPIVKKSGGDVGRFVDLTNKGIEKIDGNNLYRMLGVSPLMGHSAVPPPAMKGPGVLDRMKEAAGVAKDLVETLASGYADAATLKPEDLSTLSGAADVARKAKTLGISTEGTGTHVNGKFVDAVTGKSRAITEADRREMESFKKEIGLREAAKGGKTRADAKGGNTPSKPSPSGTSGDLKGGKYDTVVPKGREAEYRAWKAKYAPNDSGEDYDLQGAFMEGLAPDPRTGHWPDKYKKPNHPTFSVESKYAIGSDANLAGTWDGETYVPNPNAVRELWNRAVKSTGNLDGMARVFAAMSGESSLSQRGATAEQISNGHLARLIVHANETDRYNGNPANRGRRTTLLGTVKRTSHVLSPKYAWGTGPGANWFDSSKMEPRFDLINSDPVASKTARSLIMNVARFLNGDLKGKDWLPSDAVSYGDGPKGLMPDREEIKPEENRIGPMPRGFRIGRKKGAK